MTTFSSARPRVVVPRSAGPRPRATQLSIEEMINAGSADAMGGVGSGTMGGLGELVERSHSQVIVLRRALQEAAELEQAAGAKSTELHQRLEQGKRFVTDFDQRLSAAAKASVVLDAAAQALRGLEQLLGQLRAVQTSAQQAFSEQLELSLTGIQSKLDEAQQHVQTQFDEHVEDVVAQMSAKLRACEDRMAEQERRFEERLNQMQAKIDDTTGKVDHAHQRVADQIAASWSGIEKQIGELHDRMSADLDRGVASAQARVSIVLDSAAERVNIMESQGERLAGEIADRVEQMCRQGVRVLGIDPRTGSADQAPDNSLMGVLEASREMISASDAAAIRLGAILGRADDAVTQVNSAVVAAEQISTDRLGDTERIAQAIDQGVRKLAEFEAALLQATTRHQSSLSELTKVRDALGTARADLEAMATAAQYHAQSVRENEERLDAARRMADTSAETARVRAESLDRAMTQVTQQAEAMVELARDVASLVARAQSQQIEPPMPDAAAA